MAADDIGRGERLGGVGGGGGDDVGGGHGGGPQQTGGRSLKSMPSPEVALADLRAQLLDRRRALLSALAAVDAELADVQARYARLTQPAPALRLPPELLAGVFDQARRSSPAFERVASHVCATWRDVAIGLPNLWNTIDLHVRPASAAALHRLSTYLSRSQPFPLDIFISSQDFDPVLDLLLPHALRWRQLCLVTSSSCCLSIHHAMHTLTTPMLEYLSIRTDLPHNGSPEPYLNVPTLVPQILPSTPSLSFLRLAGTALWMLQPPMSNIRTMHFEGCQSMYMTHQQFRTLMATMPCLVNLSLSQLSIDPLPDVINGCNSALMALRRLRICDEDRQSGIILSLVDLPVVESLHLRNVEDFSSVPLPTVRSIALESCPFSANELWDLSQALPAITSLTMDQSVEILYALLASRNGQLKWPDLKTMTIYDLIPTNVQIFCDMVQERRHAGHPLACIRLNRRGRNVLRTKGRLQWLCDHVVVENLDAEEPWPPGLEFYDPDDL